MTPCIPRIYRPVKWDQYIIIISKNGDGLCITYFKPNSDPRKSSDTDKFCLVFLPRGTYYVLLIDELPNLSTGRQIQFHFVSVELTVFVAS